MNIFLISDSESGINFFPDLKKTLQGKIADAEVKFFFVPAILDIPLKAKELSPKADLVFAFSAFEEFSFAQEMFLEKLVDVELSSGKKILKAVDEKTWGEEPLEKENARKELSQKYAEKIIDLLFHCEKFEPK